MRYSLCLVVPPLLLACSAADTPRDPSPRQPTADSAATTLFDADPQHPWNRLHRLLYARAMPDGKVYDQESLEPLFLPQSRFLTEGASYRQAIALLDEFLKEHAERRIRDPVRRAILQRDLWAVFATTAGDARQQIRVEDGGRVSTTDQLEDAGDAGLERPAQRRELQKRLVQVMRRIALKPEEIRALADNLADAVKADAFPKAFDPQHPERPFLPPDLLAKDGPWVAVHNAQRADQNNFATPLHAAFTKGRSVFVVFLRLPGDRRASEVYWKAMQNGELPQFPEGTQTALLRRTLLIDSTGTLRESPLTESLQLRVFCKLDTGDPYMFTLRRRDLFAGRNGGLHPVGAQETSFFDFQTRGGDVFEMNKRPAAPVLMQSCTSCHARADGRGGIHTVSTIYARGDAKHPGLVPADARDQTRLTLDWVQKTYTWGLLQGLWATQPPE
jgi:hypothetical protein